MKKSIALILALTVMFAFASLTIAAEKKEAAALRQKRRQRLQQKKRLLRQ